MKYAEQIDLSGAPDITLTAQKLANLVEAIDDYAPLADLPDHIQYAVVVAKKLLERAEESDSPEPLSDRDVEIDASELRRHFARHTFTTADGAVRECVHDPYHIPDCHHLLPDTDPGTFVFMDVPHRPTAIPGVFECAISHSGGEFFDYAVSFTLWLDADSPQQAAKRASLLRYWLVNRDDPGERPTAWKPDGTFDWHLHDHDGC
jgi:hypothetical protein